MFDNFKACEINDLLDISIIPLRKDYKQVFSEYLVKNKPLWFAIEKTKISNITASGDDIEINKFSFEGFSNAKLKLVDSANFVSKE